MKVRFNAEQEALLSQIALRDGKKATEWLKDLALRAIDENRRFRAAVRQGLSQAGNDELIDDEVVRTWLDQRERPAAAEWHPGTDR
jgi:hypothetical protein